MLGPRSGDLLAHLHFLNTFELVDHVTRGHGYRATDSICRFDRSSQSDVTELKTCPGDRSPPGHITSPSNEAGYPLEGLSIDQ